MQDHTLDSNKKMFENHLIVESMNLLDLHSDWMIELLCQHSNYMIPFKGWLKILIRQQIFCMSILIG